MNGKRKKASSLAALAIAVAVGLSACSGGGGGTAGTAGTAGNGDGGNAETPPGGANEGGYTAPFANGKYEPAIEMTSIGCTPNLEYPEGQSFEDNVALDWAREKLGIDIKYLWQAPHENGGCEQKLRLSLSGNQKMPDVLHVWANSVESSNLLANLIDSGQFLDIGEAFEQYASDDLKRIMEENPQAWHIVTKDNKKYGVPLMQLAHNNDNMLYVREDWLQKLNLKAPATIEELETVMDAFVNGDPDGNGKKDTLGLAVTLEVFNSWMADASWIFGAYGGAPNVWREAADGSLVYGSIQPETKLGLAKLREWMEKGYIDKEALLHNVDKAGSLATSGKAGIFSAPFWGAQWPLADTAKNVPEAKWTMIGLPTGPDGKIGHYTLGLATHAFLINKDYAHPDAAFHYLNKLLEFALAKPGTDMEHGFMEGYDYAIVDGKVTKDPAQIPNHFDVYKATLMPEPPNDPKRNVDSFTRLSRLKEGEEPANSIDAGNWACCKDIVGNAIDSFQYIDSAYRDAFTGAPTETMRTKGDFLSKMEKETFSNIIYGQEPLDAFDSFVEKWKSSGGEQIAQEVNAWYQSVK
ncbi:extracellular solute-binding protein [Paenibacillus sp.]|uniref:extracellular solute-binding protein n=1 Tax=Paenibacillus sp. TaxID=58172 RepID=UPI0028123F25|nr:extracellular solute-binding protein [Paenibacillus sp.]